MDKNSIASLTGENTSKSKKAEQGIKIDKDPFSLGGAKKVTVSQQAMLNHIKKAAKRLGVLDEVSIITCN